MRDWKIIFDLDDTLYPEVDYVYSGFAAVGAWTSQRFGEAGFCDAAVKIFERGERKRVFNLALEECGIAESEELIREMVAVYRSHLPHIQLFPEAAEVLERFRACPLGLITDGYLEVQKKKVTALKVAGFFQSIVYSDFWGRECWKPSRVPYEQSMKDLEGAPQDFVYIADNAGKDFVTAKRLGWFTVQVVRGNGIYKGLEVHQSHRPHVIVPSLADVEKALDSAEECRNLQPELPFK